MLTDIKYLDEFIPLVFGNDKAFMNTWERIKKNYKEPVAHVDNNLFMTALGLKINIIPGLQGVYILTDSQVQELAAHLNTALDAIMRS